MSSRPEKLMPRQLLARNLKAALEKAGMSGPAVADKAKVDRKTVNNWLNARYDPKLDQLAAVASVLGYNYWQLLAPHFNVGSGVKADELLDYYEDANEDGKESIMRVAKLAAGRKP